MKSLNYRFVILLKELCKLCYPYSRFRIASSKFETVRNPNAVCRILSSSRKIQKKSTKPWKLLVACSVLRGAKGSHQQVLLPGVGYSKTRYLQQLKQFIQRDYLKSYTKLTLKNYRGTKEEKKTKTLFSVCYRIIQFSMKDSKH